MRFKFLKRDKEVKDITKEEMLEISKKIQGVILLDVRSIQEYEEGHIQGAINIPFYEIQQNAERIIKDKNSVIIAYCSAGIRSKNAIKILKKLGYKNLYNVKEGIE